MGRFVGTRRALLTLLNGLFLNSGRLTGATSYAAPVALSAGENTLSVKPLGSTTAYTLAGVVSGTGPLTVNANVTLAAAETYTGATTITVGRTLTLANNYATSGFTVPAGATLVFAPTIANQIGNTNATLAGAGTVVKSGANIWNPCAGARTFSYSMTGGVIDVQSGKITASSGYNASFTNNKSSLNVASGAIFSGVEAGVVVDALTGAGSVTLGYTNTGGLTLGVNNTAAGPYNATAGTATFTGVISPEGGVTTGSFLIKNGTGTQILTGANTYVGTTTVNAGTLQIGNSSNTGSLGPGAVSIAAGANLSINRSDNGLTIGNAFSGAGNLNFVGTGVLDQSSFNLSGNSSTFTGTININAARLQVGAATQVGATNPIAVTSGGQLHANGAITLNNPLSLAGNGWNEGAGVIGAMRVTGGVNYAGNITLTANARIATYASTGTISGGISGAFNLEFAAYNGSGTITITGNSASLSSASVTSGDLAITGTSTAVTVASGAAVGGGSAITGSVKALTFSAAGSILRVRPLSTTSVSLITATSLVNASGFTVAYASGFTVAAGVYNLLKITSTAAPTLSAITSSGLSNIGRTGATYAVTGSAGAWNLAVTLT